MIGTVADPTMIYGSGTRSVGQVTAMNKHNRRLCKKFVCKARKPGKGEAYFSYVEPFSGEAQHSRRTFFEAVNFQQNPMRSYSSPNPICRQ